MTTSFRPLALLLAAAVSLTLWGQTLAVPALAEALPGSAVVSIV